MKTRKFYRLAVILTALLLIAFGAVLKSVLKPWAFSLSGGPTLTGDWVGEITTPTGRRLPVWLNLYTEALSIAPCYDCPDFLGTVRSCGNGVIRDFEAWGSVESRSGAAFLVKTRPTAEIPHEPRLGYLNGQWRGNTLTLTTTLVVPGDPVTTRTEYSGSGKDVTRIVGGHPDARAPISWTMKRGSESEFERACSGGTTR